jgi:hypothetical protein
MRRAPHPRCVPLVIGLASLVLACDQEAAPPPTYPGECAARCVVPADGPCVGADPAGCEAACVEWTRGLTPECVECVLGHSGWAGTACSCDAAGSCWPCGFGPGAHTCQSGPGGACAVADETCAGMDLAAPDGSQCAAACSGTTPAAAPTLAAP